MQTPVQAEPPTQPQEPRLRPIQFRPLKTSSESCRQYTSNPLLARFIRPSPVSKCVESVETNAYTTGNPRRTRIVGCLRTVGPVLDQNGPPNPGKIRDRFEELKTVSGSAGLRSFPLWGNDAGRRQCASRKRTGRALCGNRRRSPLHLAHLNCRFHPLRYCRNHPRPPR
jgi:hypothetical protein